MFHFLHSGIVSHLLTFAAGIAGGFYTTIRTKIATVKAIVASDYTKILGEIKTAIATLKKDV